MAAAGLGFAGVVAAEAAGCACNIWIASLRLACLAKSSAVMPNWFLWSRSAPSVSKSLTTSGEPYMAAIIKGVVPLGDSASM